MRIAFTLAALSTIVASVPASATEPADLRLLPVSKPIVSKYGAAPMQFGELRVPAGKGPFPVVIVYHGGCLLRAVDDVRGTAALATALTKKGVATWNVEYRALGDQGAGYPGTYQDWGAGADHLRTLAKANHLDLSRVVAIGHSAGAPGAVFVASRGRLPKDSVIRGSDPLKVKAVVAIDGPPDPAALAGLDEQVCGQPIVKPFLGGTAAEQPARYKEISPKSYLPLGMPQYLISASPVLPMPLAESYAKQAIAAGDTAEVVAVKGDHFNIVAPGQPQWNEVEAVILRAVGK